MCVLSTVIFAVSGQAEDLQRFGEEMSFFYLKPSPARFEHLQVEADRLSSSLKNKNHAALLAAVVIASASDKHHWNITGKGEISAFAREIAEGKSKAARYVKDDSEVDVGKLDVWWAKFFATGELKYPEKILRYAKEPEPGERAVDFMMPAMAAWSFKSNCQQHKAVMAFAKECLESNRMPGKTAFLKDCVTSKPQAKTNR